MTVIHETADLGYVSREFEIFDDFTSQVDADLWTAIADGTGTVAVGDGENGILTCTTQAADDMAAGIVTTHELFKLAVNRSMHAKGRICFEEIDNPNADANLWFGWGDALASDVPINDANALAINADGVGLYKLAGSDKWSLVTQINGGTATTTESDLEVDLDAATYQEVELIVQHKTNTSSTAGDLSVTAKVDGAQLVDANGKKIEHTITIGTATEMDFGALVKTSTANAEVLKIDYLRAGQTR